MRQQISQYRFVCVLVLSSVLFLAICLAWAVSQLQNNVVGYAGWRDQRARIWRGGGADSRKHQLILFYYRGDVQIQDPGHVSGASVPPGFFHNRWPARGWQRGYFPGLDFKIVTWNSISLWFFVAPYWMLALISAILPGAAIIRYIRKRRTPLPGHCISCGYDLRETPVRCPECGTNVVRSLRSIIPTS